MSFCRFSRGVFGASGFFFDFFAAARYDKNMSNFDKNSILSLPYPLRLSHKEETTSTNDDMKAAAREGAPDFTLIVADRQTAGKGRLGRSFFSEGGLYMSLLLPYREETFRLLTHAAAVAVAEAIAELTGEDALIKWVNDVYVDGKKVCGILSESVDVGTRRPIVGIGVNLNTPQQAFPAEIAGIAASVNADRSMLVKSILSHLLPLYLDGEKQEIQKRYRALSLLNGKSVLVQKQNDCRTATVLDLTDDLALSVLYEDGSREDLIAADVSLRLV